MADLKTIKIVDLPPGELETTDVFLKVKAGGEHQKVSGQSIIDTIQGPLVDAVQADRTAAEAAMATAIVKAGEAEASAVKASVNAGQVSTPYDEKGPYNVLTNTPTLTANAHTGSTWVPGVSGKPQRRIVNVAGPIQFAIMGKDDGEWVGIGSLVEDISGQWFHIPEAETALGILAPFQVSFIFNPDGRWQIVDSEGRIMMDADPAGKSSFTDLEAMSIKVAGVEVTPANYAALTEFTTLAKPFQTDPENGQTFFLDGEGRISALISAVGLWNIYQANIQELSLYKAQFSGFSLVSNDEYPGAITDSEGRIIANLIPKEKRVAGFTADVVLFLVGGQSLGTGEGSGGTLVTAHLTAEPHVETFNKGPYIYLYEFNGDSDIYNSLKDSVEYYYETPCDGMARKIKQIVQAENFVINDTDRVFKMLTATAAKGGQPLANLVKGTDSYTRMMNCVINGQTRARERGQTFDIASMFFVQGEADISAQTNPLTWKKMMLDMQNNFDIDVKAAVPTKRNKVCWILAQTASIYKSGTLRPEISLAQLDLALNYPGFYLGPALYSFDYNVSDQVHLLNGTQYAIMGAYAGVMAKRVAIDGKDLKPIYVIDTQINQKFLDLYFNIPHSGLVFDETLVAPIANKGFRAFNVAGVEQTFAVTNGVQIVRPDTVRLRFDVNVEIGWTITYAINGASGVAGKTNGPRGNLRDSMGSDHQYLGTPLHQWCPIFSHTVKN